MTITNNTNNKYERFSDWFIKRAKSLRPTKSSSSRAIFHKSCLSVNISAQRVSSLFLPFSFTSSKHLSSIKKIEYNAFEFSELKNKT
jgi:hypothetical protein